MKAEQVQVQVQVQSHHHHHHHPHQHPHQHPHHHQDLHAAVDHMKDVIPNGFSAMEEEGEGLGGVDPREIWLDNDHDAGGGALLGDVNDDASIFYNDHFPPLPDFPCMSSSSSSSSTPAPVKTVTCSSSSSSVSSSAASWAVLRSDGEEDGDKKEHHSHDNNNHYSQDVVVDAQPGTLSSTASMEISQLSDLGGGGGIDCMDTMETFGYMDLFESNEFFDPSSIFQPDSFMDHFQTEDDDQQVPQQQQQLEDHHQHHETPQQLLLHDHLHQMHVVEGNMDNNNNEEAVLQEEDPQKNNDNKDPDDMAMVFLDWLRSNRETVSAEDLRNVKLKKSTIECAARRLGGGKEAMKQLLKLVLEWVQTNHLQKRRNNCTTKQESNLGQQFQDPFQNPNPNPNPNTQSPWMPPHAAAPYDPVGAAAAPIVVRTPQAYPSQMIGYMSADPFVNGSGSNINTLPYQTAPVEYHHTPHMLESVQSWPSSPFAMASPYGSFSDNNIHLAPQPQHHPQAFTGYGSQHQYQQYQYFQGQGGGDQRLARLGSSVTKEARKKRMARQRRLVSHHNRHHGHQQNQHPNQIPDHQHARLGNTDTNCTTAEGAAAVQPLLPAQANPGNWFYWPTPSPTGPAMMPTIQPEVAPTQPQPVVHQVDRPAPATQGQGLNHYQGGRIAPERRQGWKPEKNLRFLLQKVLKQSDVGNLGRIVLPKKEAETHLPELEARDGISIAMEDIGTSRVWNMRYRYWPNNKSRMYLLENTGDFVRANGLQEGDFIVIYSDVKCGKYMIRGVKVRQAGPKSEGANKRAGKAQRNQQAGPNGSSSSSATTTTQHPNKKQ